jgi:hypothetical protein
LGEIDSRKKPEAKNLVTLSLQIDGDKKKAFDLDSTVPHGKQRGGSAWVSFQAFLSQCG